MKEEEQFRTVACRRCRQTWKGWKGYSTSSCNFATEKPIKLLTVSTTEGVDRRPAFGMQILLQSTNTRASRSSWLRTSVSGG
ncbi:hypothetical protein JB92DRAFT_1264301 [Gautieria morchelliformis]|nr:hypothetical protein JB92DRAFT_1264301 [Gautieria morchelliformis]